MWRICLLLIVMIPACVLADGEPETSQTAQVKPIYCAAVAAVQGETTKGTASGVSLRGLAATLGTGLLSLLCLVPVALLSERLMGRDKAADGGLRVV